MLHIFVEKSFLDTFYETYSAETATKYQHTLYQVLIEYPETKWYLDCTFDTLEDFENIKKENPLIALKAAAFPPQPVLSLQESINKVDTWNTLLVLTKGDIDWGQEIKQKGGLHFTLDNYEEKLSEIFNSYHYKIDLAEKGFKWGDLQTLPFFNQVLLNDNYILIDRPQDSINYNLAQLLKEIVADYKQEVVVKIFSKEFGALQPKGPEQQKIAVTDRLDKLKEMFADYNIRFKVINNALPSAGFRFHDRVLMTNFQSIDCGVGFNLFSNGKGKYKVSNSQIVSETIFDLYTYKRIKNIRKVHRDYFNKIAKPGYSIQFTYM